MPNYCKYCQNEILWSQINGKNIPMNLDNSNHRCQANNKPTQQTSTVQDEITNLVQLLEKVLRGR